MNLKSIRTKVLKPFVFNVNPNKVTFLSLLTGIGAGFLFAFDHLLIGAAILSLSGFLDLLDGEIAKKKDLKTPEGDIFDHVADRIVDMAAFGGIAFSSFVRTELGLITAVVILMISYLGTQSQAVLGQRLYKGVLGRFPRTISLIAIVVLGRIDHRFLMHGMVVILGFAIITVLERLWEIKKNIG